MIIQAISFQVFYTIKKKAALATFAFWNYLLKRTLSQVSGLF